MEGVGVLVVAAGSAGNVEAKLGVVLDDLHNADVATKLRLSFHGLRQAGQSVGCRQLRNKPT